MRVLIVDDEPLARSRLNRLLADIHDVEVIGSAENGAEAVRLVTVDKPDLVFLDINMPIKNGIQAAREIAAMGQHPPAIIFCTAYDEYALEAFEVQASAYLMKPVNRNELQKALDKAAPLTQLHLNKLIDMEGDSRAAQIAVQRFGSIENHALADFLYFRAEQKQVVGGLVSGPEVILDQSLKALENKFSEYFVRAHRSVLVNKSKISKLSRDDKGRPLLWLSGCDQPFQVSRRHLTTVKQCFSSP